MKELRIIGALSILSLLALSLLGSAYGQARMPGVSAGDSFKYTYAFDTNISSNSGFALPSLFESVLNEAKSIDSTQITILDVSGTKVTAQMVTQFKNNTQQSSTGVTDVSNGEGNLTMFLIAANLNPNDPIYLGNNDEKINGTLAKNYPSGSRQVNFESITMDYTVTEEELSGLNITGTLQQTNSQYVSWDKQSGTLVEMSYTMVTRSPQVNADISVEVTLVESNVYTVPEYPALIVVLIALIISTITLIKLRGRMRSE